LVYVDEFLNAIKKVKGDDLAFIMTNTKAERHIVGRVGYQLSLQLDDNHRVAIEHKRKDLVILNGETQEAVFEVKCYFAHDNIGTRKRDIEGFKRDLKKLSKAECEKAYFVLFIVDFCPDYPEYFKYSQPNKKKSLNLGKVPEIFKKYKKECTDFKDIGTCDSYRAKLMAMIWHIKPD
jgi:hypothetical protein